LDGSIDSEPSKERSIAMATKTRQAARKSGELGLFDLAEVLWQDNITEAQ